MQQIGAAIFLAERNIGCPNIEKKDVLALGPVGKPDQGGGLSIDDNEMVSRLVKLL